MGLGIVKASWTTVILPPYSSSIILGYLIYRKTFTHSFLNEFTALRVWRILHDITVKGFTVIRQKVKRFLVTVMDFHISILFSLLRLNLLNFTPFRETVRSLHAFIKTSSWRNCSENVSLSVHALPHTLHLNQNLR